MAAFQRVLSGLRTFRPGTGNEDSAFVRRNVVSLYCLYFAAYFSSVITLPYLTRTLGPEAFGVYAGAQAYAWCVQMLVEYGFNFSGSKAAQLVRHDAGALGTLIADVLGAKLLMFSIAAAATVLLRSHLPALAHSWHFLCSALLFGLAQGLSPVWIYQGTDRMKLFTVMDLIVKLCGTVSIIVFVKTPQHGALALAFQAAAAAVSTSIGTLLIHKHDVPLRIWSVAGVRRALLEGKSLFAYRLTTNIQMYANPLILSLFAAPQYVAFYSGPERLVKFLLMTVSPFSEAIYPFLSRKFDRSVKDGRDIATTILLFTVIWTSVIGMGLFVFAPQIIRMTFGKGYGESVDVIRILALFPLLAGIVNSLGIQWMLPAGLYRDYNRIIVVSFIAHILLASFLATRFRDTGMAVAVVASQLFSGSLMLFRIKRSLLGSRDEVCVASSV